MASSISHSNASSSGENLPSEGVRTAITFGLIVYLFLLVIGWLTSSSMGTSPLCSRLHDTILQPLNAALLTERYEFNGVNDARYQVGAVVQVVPYDKDGAALPTQFYPLPDKLADRHQQYLQELINNAASYAGNREDASADTLMTVVSGEILRETGASQIKLRCYLPANDYETVDALFRQSPQARVSDKNIRDDGLTSYESLFSAIASAQPHQSILYSRDSGTALSAPAVKLTPKPKATGASSSSEELNSKAPKKLPPVPADAEPESHSK